MEDLKDGMCRCCASEGTFKDFTASYQWMGVEEIYSEMLRDCFDITLSTSLLNNGGICELCITQLRNAFNFKKQVQSTEEQFTKMQDRFLKGDIVKKELNQDPMENSDGGDNIDDDFSSPEYDVPIQSIKLEKIDTKTKKRPARATTSKAKKPKVEAGEPSGKRFKEELGYQLSIEYEPRHEENVQRKRDVNTIISNTKSILKDIHTFTNASPLRNVVGANFICHLCPMGFPDSGELKRHTLDEHLSKNIDDFINELFSGKIIPTIKLDITSLKCKCNANLNSLDELFEHLVDTHKRKLHTDVKNIIIPFKFVTNNWTCCVCDKEFGTFKTLLEHMNTHITNYTCELCNTTFITCERLKIHMKFSHDVGSFKCNFCPKVFNTKLKMYYHERGVHTKKNKIKNCEHCDERFETLWERQKHQFKKHGVAVSKLTKVTCSVCEREFSDQSAHNLHFRRCHLLEKNHKCGYCDMRFFDTSSLRKHIYKHTGEKNYQCQVCSKSFSLKNTLTEHMRIHNNDRRYRCEHCGQTFVQRCSWRGHLRTKHGVGDKNI